MADLRSRIEQALGTGHRIERELGGGGMSRVFLAEETSLGRRVVVKVLPPEMAATVNAERFQREIRTVAALHHPNIVALISAGGTDDLLWFTMPFVEGESLRARLTREGELPIGDAVRIWGEMLDALSYAHGRGTVHRDIKPENVLLSGRHALVADFGVSKALATATGERSATVTGLALGTPAYMAPEQAAADPNADHRGDLYSAGLVMYEMLTGRSPFADRTPVQQMAAHATVPPPPIRERREQVSPALESLVLSCLAKRPADRPQTADAVLSALSGVPDVTPGTATRGSAAGGASGSGVHSGVGDATGRDRADTGRRRARLVALSLTGLAVAAAATFAVTRAGPSGTSGAPLADSARVSVLVLPAVYDPADSLLARSAQQTILGRLRNDRRIAVVEPQETPIFGNAILGLQGHAIVRDSLVRWAPDMGVHTHLTLTLARAATGYLVSGVVRATARDTTLLNLQLAAAEVTAVPEVVARIAEQAETALLRSYGRLRRPDPDGALLGTTPEAARFARDGWEAFERRDYFAAADAARGALRHDSTFAMAWVNLSFSLGNAGVRTDERLRALAQAHRHRARMRFRNAGIMVEADYRRETGDDAGALAAYERLDREFGAGGGNDNNKSLLFSRLRRFDDARRVLERIRDTTYLTPWVANTNYTTALLDLGRFDEYARERDSLLAHLGPDHPVSLATVLQGLRSRRRSDSIVVLTTRQLAAARGVSARVQASTGLRDALVQRGRLEEASRVQRERASDYGGVGAEPTRLNVNLYHVVWRMRLAGDTAAAGALLDEALRETDFDALAPMDKPWANAITAHAYTGRLARARELAAAADREIPAEFARAFQSGLDEARGELALVEGDARAALAHFRRADRGACVPCSYPRYARAYDGLGNADSALVYYERYVTASGHRLGGVDATQLAPAYRRAGELHEAKGDLRMAIERYRQFVEVWKDADPLLQPQVEDVKARIARLQARIG